MDDTQNVTPVSDVPAVEANTTPDSSNGEQTAQQEQVGTTPQVETVDKVPVQNRIAEYNRRLEKAEREAQQLRAQQAERPQAENLDQDAVRAALEPILNDMGYVRKADVEQEFNMRELDRQTNEELSQLEKRFDGSDGRPKFDRDAVVKWGIERGILDPEAAYERMHRDEILDWHVKQAMTKSQGVKTESSDGSGSQSVGTTNSDLIDAAARGDQSAKRTFLKRFVPKFD